jgi:hypothetical protein
MMAASRRAGRAKAVRSVISPVMEIMMRDELERDLADLCGAVRVPAAERQPKSAGRRAPGE